MKNNAHSKFRTTKVWAEFRQSILDQRPHRCELCGIYKKPKGLQLHHLHPADYTNLSNPDDFALLCSDCHSMIEKMAKRFKGKKADTILNPELWRQLYGRFFPTN